MSFPSLGDASQQFRLSRGTGQIKSDISRLSAELSSGQVGDKTRALGGDTARLSGIDHSLAILRGHAQTADETAITLTATQTALASFDAKRVALSDDLLRLTRESTAPQVETFAAQAGAMFTGMVDTLNTRVADRTLLAGAAVDSAALAPADAMLADMRALLGPTPLIADYRAVVANWFDDPAGGFAILGYQGDTGQSPDRQVGETSRVLLDARADDPGLRATLKAAALAALAAESTTLSTADKATLLQESGVALHAAADGVVALQARVGFAQEKVDLAQAETAAQQTALSKSRNDLISKDPFETATALQAMQTQLELHFAMTARLSGLSLVNYL